MTFHRSEYYDRARYDADCLKYLLGLIDKRPFILDYDENTRERPAHPKEGADR